MGDLIQAPAVRLTYEGIDNPLYDSDIVVANQMALSMLVALSGLGSTDFAIISGFTYTAGTPNTFSGGFFYLNGQFYYLANGFTEGLYLTPNPTPSQLQAFDDGNSRNIYTVNYGNTAPAAIAGVTSPQMMGNMNDYRMGNKYLSQAVVSLLATQASLGAAAFMSVGTTAGTVAAGNDPRMPYTAAQIATILSNYALITQVLTFGNSGSFTPAVPNDPATKLYVDATSGKVRAKNVVHIGDVSNAGTEVTVSLGFTMPDINCIIMLTVVSLSASGGTDVLFAPMVRNVTTSSFDIYLREGSSNVQNVSVNWIIFGL